MRLFKKKTEKNIENKCNQTEVDLKNIIDKIVKLDDSLKIIKRDLENIKFYEKESFKILDNKILENKREISDNKNMIQMLINDFCEMKKRIEELEEREAERKIEEEAEKLIEKELEEVFEKEEEEEEEEKVDEERVWNMGYFF